MEDYVLYLQHTFERYITTLVKYYMMIFLKLALAFLVSTVLLCHMCDV